MIRLLILTIACCIFLPGLQAKQTALFSTDAMEGVPVAYQGRFREFSAFASLWWFDLFHSAKIAKNERAKLNAETPIEIAWKFHFHGHAPWDRVPLFFISNDSVKTLLALSPLSQRFSFEELKQATQKPQFLEDFAALEFNKQSNQTANQGRLTKIELKRLSPGLWIGINNEHLNVLAHPETLPWSLLPVGSLQKKNRTLTGPEESLLTNLLELQALMHRYSVIHSGPSPQEELFSSLIKNLKSQGLTPKRIAETAEKLYPLRERLRQSDDFMKLLPSKRHRGEWYPLSALWASVYDQEIDSLRPASNFTAYPDPLFNDIRATYLSLHEAVLARNNTQAEKLALSLGGLLRKGYEPLAGNLIFENESKSLHYPTLMQLKAENFYYKMPLIETCLFFYGMAFCGFILAISLKNKRIELASTFALALGFICHTLIISLRSYILWRPPVSNMFETVIYVPWVTVLLSFPLRFLLKTPMIFIGSTFTAMALLVLLKISNLNNSMENVQAVLDSQYWLTVHVMMIVGSYGIFALSGILSHIYITGTLVTQKELPWQKYTAESILQTLYIGVALLIPGTILGGVWAAQSWGRFWDWDPKESWAFISSCIYLVFIHAYRFKYIGNFCLSLGSITGFMAITFTWYGVNYLLGSGLHSYGFGTGGTGYYYSYLLAETAFLGVASSIFFLQKKKKMSY